MLPASVRRLASVSRPSLGPALEQALQRGAPVDVHPEVEEALHARRPVVALESAIITNGMPQPTNLETARSVEQRVRSAGSVPATIGIIRGRVKIGMDAAELEHLADLENNSAVKVSRMDIGPALALRRSGGTTCSTTLVFAALAGIKVFATGGLGGVHRGGENSMDVSADLHELSRYPVGLVSAGIKSILDIGRTLEYLETLGVPVISYAKTSDFPAFYSPRSGFKTPWNVDDPTQAAEILLHYDRLGMGNGALFGVPIPEAYHAVGAELQEAVDQAVREAEENGVSKRGKSVTPWLLERVKQLTAGKSLASNIALIENTAFVGGQIAAAYSDLLANGPSDLSQPQQDSTISSVITSKLRGPIAHIAETEKAPSPLVVVGSAAVDVTSQISEDSDPSLGKHSTSPGAVSLSLGGVGRNIAEAAHRILTSQGLAQATKLISGVAEDAFGRLLLSETARLGMRTDGFLRPGSDSARSAICNLVLDARGDLQTGVADMGLIYDLQGQGIVEELAAHKPDIVAIDANLSPGALKAVVTYCLEHRISTFFEPTSVLKATAILPALAASMGPSSLDRSPIGFISPNRLELKRIYSAARAEPFDLMNHQRWWDVIQKFRLGSHYRMDLDLLARQKACEQDIAKGSLDFLVEDGVAQMAVNLLPFFEKVVIKCGSQGLVVAMRISHNAAQSSGWTSENTNIHRRYVVAHGDSETVVIMHCPASIISPEAIVNVTGCGDSLVGSLLASLIMNPRAFDNPETLQQTLSQSQKAAALTLQSPNAVASELSTMEHPVMASVGGV